jgi:hypothetical protein
MDSFKLLKLFMATEVTHGQFFVKYRVSKLREQMKK